MKRKILAGLIVLMIAQSSFALDKCSTDGKHCKLDPFAPAVVAFARICSERQPENAKYYQAVVAAVFNGHQKEYKQLIADTEFQEKFREIRKEILTRPKAEIDSECEDVLSMGKDAAQQRLPKK